MTVIDAHVHLLEDDFAPELLREGDRLGVDVFIGSSICRFEHYPGIAAVTSANDDMHAVTLRHPEQVLAYCFVNPWLGDSALTEFRRRFEDQGMIGVKLWVSALADDPIVFPVVEQAITYRAPLLIHAWRKTDGTQLPDESTASHVGRLAERYPEARIIMAHLGGQVESAINAIAPYPNVRVDTSGTLVGARAVEIAVRRLGAERVVFGSDAHIGCLAANIGKVVGAGLSSEERCAVMGLNMRRLLDEVVR
jgi:uncharacterized protein